MKCSLRRVPRSQKIRSSETRRRDGARQRLRSAPNAGKTTVQTLVFGADRCRLRGASKNRLRTHNSSWLARPKTMVAGPVFGARNCPAGQRRDTAARTVQPAHNARLNVPEKDWLKAGYCIFYCPDSEGNAQVLSGVFHESKPRFNAPQSRGNGTHPPSAPRWAFYALFPTYSCPEKQVLCPATNRHGPVQKSRCWATFLRTGCARRYGGAASRSSATPTGLSR